MDGALFASAGLLVVRAAASAWIAAGHDPARVVQLVAERAAQLPADRCRSILAEVQKALPQVSISCGAPHMLMKMVSS